MILKARLEDNNLVLDIEVVFTSATKEGVHYFNMVKPIKLTNKRFKWEPQEGKPRTQPLFEAILWVLENNKPKWWSLP
jgi:hypothetical protein